MQKPSATPAIRRLKTAPARKLHSIHVLLSENVFKGRIEHGRQGFECQFKPTSTAITDGRLVITGDMTIRAGRQRARVARGVRAVLASMQGGIGGSISAPLRYASRIITPPAETTLPVTESTGARGYAGVLYFHLSEMDGRRLGVPLDLSRVQMNARLWPTSQVERDLQWYFSAVAGALLGEVRDENLAREYTSEIEKILLNRS